MQPTTLYIKNMVCNRCIKVVREELSKLGITPVSVELGKVDLDNPLSEEDMAKVNAIMSGNGFELINDRKSRTIERIKILIIELIHYQRKKARHINLSDFIAKEIGYDYAYLSNLFSSVEGTTIEKYLNNQKIERVKELLVYDELTLSEIANQMGYSSVQHLSGQFRKITGLTPSHFKKIKDSKRKPIDKV